MRQHVRLEDQEPESPKPSVHRVPVRNSSGSGDTLIALDIEDGRQRDRKTAPAGPRQQRGALRVLLLGSKLNVLLCLGPFALISHNRWNDGLTFFFSLAAICPLAERLGFVTERLSTYTNSTLSGLLNATFGNATEVIVSIFGLRAGLLRVVQLSLLGSVLSNQLLVLGCAFFFGGLRFKEQKFNAQAASVNAGLLLLASAACALPSLLLASAPATSAEEKRLAAAVHYSRGASVILLLLYCAFLYFQLSTHAHLFEDAPREETEKKKEGEEDKESEEEEEEEQELSFAACLWGLAAITVALALLSDALVDAIEGAAKAVHMPLPFISLVLLPIVGNAAEHTSAIIFARKNKLDLALGIAVGSATQIASGVLPLIVLLGACMAAPLSLNVQPFEAGALVLSTLCVAHALGDGKSTWLKGAVLVGGYIILATASAVRDDPVLAAEHKRQAVR